jgi:hypothetical protein
MANETFVMTKRQSSAARQRNAKAKPRGKPRGKPFAPANPYRWQPGQSGNPAGNADTLVVRAALLRHAQREATDSLAVVAGLTWLDRIAIAQILRAGEDTDGFNAFADRIDGKPKQTAELSGPGGGPIEVAATDYRSAIAALAPDEGGPVGDSDAPGQDQSNLHGPEVG